MLKKAQNTQRAQQQLKFSRIMMTGGEYGVPGTRRVYVTFHRTKGEQ
jgi:hypothetical protein